MDFTKSHLQHRLTYVFDLDGVIYRGIELQPHAAEVIEALRSSGHNIRFYTNNATKTRDSYTTRLASMGISANSDEVMTSSYATALYLMDIDAVGKTVLQVGENGMKVELEAVGMKVLRNDEESDARIDFVVVGLDREFNYKKLARAQRAIHEGARFIATNEDATFPVEGGALLPGGGFMVSAVRTATSVDPLVIGKPETYAFDKILEMTNTPPDHSIMVGDRLDTDILVGNRAGAQTVLVLTGISSREEAQQAVGDMRPDRIIDTLAELL